MDLEELEILTKKAVKETIKPKPLEVKKVSLGLDVPAKTVVIGIDLDPK